MRHFAITAYLLIRTVFAIGQIANEDLNFFNYTYNKAIIIKNKVETVTVETSFPDSKGLSNTIYYFDKNGLLTKQTIIDTAGFTKREFYFITNSHQDLVSRIQRDFEFKRVDTVHYFKSYEGDNLIKDSSSEIPISFNYEYAKNGKLIKTTVNSNFDLGYNPKKVIINHYDSLNRIVKCVETVYQNQDDLIGTNFSDRTFFYNANNKIEKEVENLNGKYPWMAKNGSINYEYDPNGNLTKIIGDFSASYFYTYNEKGLITIKKMDMKLESDDINDKVIKIETVDKFTYTYRQ